MTDNLHPLLVIIEPSDILFEGLLALIKQQGTPLSISRLSDPEEINKLSEDNLPDLVVLNPGLLINKARAFKNMQRKHPGIKWLALVYSHFSKDHLALFDDTIDICSSAVDIANCINRSLSIHSESEPRQEPLSEREIDVLLLLVKGLQNKEIADKLNISIHTVISHRKNISIKTGIRSQAGLVIYAISNKIIPLQSLEL